MDHYAESDSLQMTMRGDLCALRIDT